MNNRIDEILANLECAAVDGGFSLSVKDGEIVAKDLLSEEPLSFIVRFTVKTELILDHLACWFSADQIEEFFKYFVRSHDITFGDEDDM